MGVKSWFITTLAGFHSHLSFTRLTINPSVAFQRFLLSKKNRGNVVCIQIRTPENETLSQAGGFQPVATAWHWYVQIWEMAWADSHTHIHIYDIYIFILVLLALRRTVLLIIITIYRIYIIYVYVVYTHTRFRSNWSFASNSYCLDHQYPKWFSDSWDWFKPEKFGSGTSFLKFEEIATHSGYLRAIGTAWNSTR